jgi:dihydrofolate reductase
VSRIIVSTFVSLDGVMESPESWSLQYQDQENAQDALALLLGCEALLLGRRTYDGFAEAWPGRQDPMGFADKLNRMPKFVASTTLTEPSWANTTLLTREVAGQVRELKARLSGDLLIYGSGVLTRHLMQQGLIDEYRLLLCPVVVGEGERLFQGPEQQVELMLSDVTRYPGGMARLTLLAAASGVGAPRPS